MSTGDPGTIWLGFRKLPTPSRWVGYEVGVKEEEEEQEEEEEEEKEEEEESYVSHKS